MRNQWIIIILVLVGGAFLLRLLLPVISPEKIAPKPNQVQKQKKTYADKENYFSVQVPANWNIHESTATNTTGLKTGYKIKQEIEVTQLSGPGQTGITVQVYRGQLTCPLAKKPTTTLAGLPASYDTVTHLWTIPTTTGTVVVSMVYPGSGGFHGPLKQTNSSRASQSQMSADKQIVDSVLSTVKFNNLQPFSCN